MGAYENPRLINAPNYLAGFQAFEQKFQKGFEEGIETVSYTHLTLPTKA